MYRGVYSEFEVTEMHLKLLGVTGATYQDMNCVGKSEEELEAKTITKKCRGVVQRTKVKGTGNGKLKVSLHVPKDIYNGIYALTREVLKEGVMAYGQGSKHPEVGITQKVLDEDDEVKLKAYPRAILTSGPKRAIENGQEEVPELELEFDLLPDEYGECMYEAVEDDITDNTVKTTWLTGFTSDLVRTSTNSETPATV